MLIFLGFAVTLIILIHLYLWQRLVRDTLRDRRWRRVGGWAVLAAVLLLFATLFGDRLLPDPAAAVLNWVGYLWLGVMFYLLMALFALELPVLLARGLLWWRSRRAAPAGAAPGAAEVSVPARAAELVASAEVAAPADATVSAGPAGPEGSEGPAGLAAPAVPAPGAGARQEPEPGSPIAGRGEAAGGVSRRMLLRRAAAITAGLAATGISGYGVSRAYGTPKVERLTVPLAKLDRRADGLRVAVVADLHVSPTYGAGAVARVVDLLNDLSPDVVTLVGDMVTSEVGRVRDGLAPLSRVRGRYGVYAVTGNHEYYTGHEEWVEAAEELGLRVLRNQRVEIAHRGGVIDLAGVNDRDGDRYADPPDYEAALGDRDPSRPVLLMAHQPVQVHRAAEYGVDLQVSGHTHGGQVYPFDYLVRLEQPVVSGLARVDGTLLYVTNGAGFWGPPMRVGADPEVTLLELRAAD